MPIPATLALLTLWAGLAAPHPAPDPAGPSINVTVDSRRREVVVKAGPFVIPASAHGAHAEHGMQHHAPGQQTPFLPFDWPATGWLRGFRLTLTSADGRPLERRLIHHVNMMNFERRALLYDALERTLAVGQETEDISLPRSVGFPMREGMPVGLVAAWANDADTAIAGVMLTITLELSPTNLSPRPVDVLPLYLDVNYQGPGVSDSYDLPAGRSIRSHEFTLPIGGRLLGVGGHLHDYARNLRLEEVESGRVVVRLNARLTREGRIVRVEQRLFGVRGDGIRLHEGRRYRIVAEYDNPTGATIPSGAMGIMIGLFAPEDIRTWPAVDRDNPAIRADIEHTLGGPGHRH